MEERYNFYQVNAFTKESFKGNPAAVCIVNEWPGDKVLQAIAADNNLSETAFLKPVDEDYEIRWFTPVTEVALCGHATLAAAHVVFEFLHPQWNEVIFHTRYSGDLFLYPDNGQIAMDLPAIPVEKKINNHGLSKLKAPIKEVYESDKLILKLSDEKAVQDFQPNPDLIAGLHEFGVAVTAQSDQEGVDFVSRFFAPNAGIDEDPVTGSLHCALGDLWEKELQKDTMEAQQLSHRGGDITVTMRGERILIKGHAKTVITGDYWC